MYGYKPWYIFSGYTGSIARCHKWNRCSGWKACKHHSHQTRTTAKNTQTYLMWYVCCLVSHDHRFRETVPDCYRFFFLLLSHGNWYEDLIPVDVIYRHSMFKLIDVFWLSKSKPEPNECHFQMNYIYTYQWLNGRLQYLREQQWGSCSLAQSPISYRYCFLIV